MFFIPNLAGAKKTQLSRFQVGGMFEKRRRKRHFPKIHLKRFLPKFDSSYGHRHWLCCLTTSPCLLFILNATKRLEVFFNVGPPDEDIFFGHLSPVFQSSLHITFTSCSFMCGMLLRFSCLLPCGLESSYLTCLTS